MPALVLAFGVAGWAQAQTLPAAASPQANPKPKWISEVARDGSRPVKAFAGAGTQRAYTRIPDANGVIETRPERGAPTAGAAAKGNRGDAAVQSAALLTASVGSTIANFEGLSNANNASVVGGRVAPPDPVGAVGPNHYVQMINLVFSVYDKSGNQLIPPTALGALWEGFAVAECADNAGDPIVVYDQFADRWLLTQFTANGPEYFSCVAISQTPDPTGAYYRYAFSAGEFFPDYPKYGSWTDSYVITTREFGPTVEYGIGVYALEKNKMINGEPNARAVRFFLDGNDPDILPLVGDGLLPAYVDGKQKPPPLTPIPLLGTQDDGYFYGAAVDALNVWELDVKWRSTPLASLKFKVQLPSASFDSSFPCTPDSRSCLAQPGTTRKLDILSYRQRPLWRLAYRNFKSYESLVTVQAVEASAGVAGMRWYEVRRSGGAYSIYQQGTFAPADGVNRWMGSAAMDRKGNIAMGYSVVNATTVFPGIRYTGRLAADPLGQMTLGEGTIINGSAPQTNASRWGDYTSMNIDPVDDCTFWYTNQYVASPGIANWQTRIGSFRLPGCAP